MRLTITALATVVIALSSSCSNVVEPPPNYSENQTSTTVASTPNAIVNRTSSGATSTHSSSPTTKQPNATTVGAPKRIQSAASAAAAVATNLGHRSGVAIYHIPSQTIGLGGEGDRTFHSQSTVKPLIAARLLKEGKLPTSNSAKRMITHSDDSVANALYAPAGGDALIKWASSYTGVTIGNPPKESGWWGRTMVTPRGVVTFLAVASQDPEVGPWLTSAMRDTAAVAADGHPQSFGLRAADPSAPVKQGWGGDAAGNIVGTPSIGYLKSGEYAVAIYTEGKASVGYAGLEEVVNAQAKTLLTTLNQS